MPKVSFSTKPKHYVSTYKYSCPDCKKEINSPKPLIKAKCCGYYMNHVEIEKVGQLNLFDLGVVVNG
jgi:hypothetical protein